MFLRWISPLIILSILVGSGCGQEDLSAAPPDPNAVASFNGGVITRDQVKARYDELLP